MNENEMKKILIEITLDIARQYGDSEELLEKIKYVIGDRKKRLNPAVKTAWLDNSPQSALIIEGTAGEKKRRKL